MVLHKTLISGFGIAVLAGASFVGAKADTQFASATTNGVFNWDGASFSTSGGLATKFTFLIDTKVYNAGKTVDATLALTGLAQGQAVTINGAVLQGLQNITETVTENGTGHNLVSLMTPASGALYGDGNNLSLTIQGNNLFSSDYFNLAGRQTQTITFTTNSLLHVTTSSGGTSGTLDSFTAAAKSDVFSSSSVPETSTLIGLGGLILGGGFVGLRRRKA